MPYNFFNWIIKLKMYVILMTKHLVWSFDQTTKITESTEIFGFDQKKCYLLIFFIL